MDVNTKTKQKSIQRLMKNMHVHKANAYETDRTTWTFFTSQAKIGLVEKINVRLMVHRKTVCHSPHTVVTGPVRSGVPTCDSSEAASDSPSDVASPSMRMGYRHTIPDHFLLSSILLEIQSRCWYIPWDPIATMYCPIAITIGIPFCRKRNQTDVALTHKVTYYKATDQMSNLELSNLQICSCQHSFTLHD